MKQSNRTYDSTLLIFTQITNFDVYFPSDEILSPNKFLKMYSSYN